MIHLVRQSMREFRMVFFAGRVLLVELVQQGEHFLIFRDILHLFAVVDVAGDTLAIDDHLSGHASKFEQVDFLPIHTQDRVFWIRQAGEWHIEFIPVLAELLRAFWANDDDEGVAKYEFLIVLAQLRHLPLAEWSYKPTIEHQKHVFLSYL